MFSLVKNGDVFNVDIHMQIKSEHVAYQVQDGRVTAITILLPTKASRQVP